MVLTHGKILSVVNTKEGVSDICKIVFEDNYVFVCSNFSALSGTCPKDLSLMGDYKYSFILTRTEFSEDYKRLSWITPSSLFNIVEQKEKEVSIWF